MRPVTNRFTRALRGPHLIATQCDLWFPGATTAVTVPIEDGSVTCDRTADIRRTGTVQIPWALEAGADLGVDVRDLPYGGYVDLYRGLQFPGAATTYATVKATYATYTALKTAKPTYADMLTGTGTSVELVQLGHYRIESVTWGTTSRSASLELADRMAQIRDEPFTTPYVAPAGLTVARAGTLTDDSAIITGLAKTSDILVGSAVSGPGVPAGRTISSVNSSSQVTMSGPAQLDTTKGYTWTSGSNILTSITPDTTDLSVGMLWDDFRTTPVLPSTAAHITTILSTTEVAIDQTPGPKFIVTKTCAVHPGDPVVDNLTSTSDLQVGDVVTEVTEASSAHIPSGTVILNILSANKITLSKTPTGTAVQVGKHVSFSRPGTFTDSSRIYLSATTQTLTFGTGTRVAAAAVDIVDDVFAATIDYQLLYDPAVTLGDVAFMGSRTDALNQFANAVGAEVYFDATGDFVFGPPPGAGDPVATIDAGQQGVLVGADESLDRTGVYNGVLITGQAAGTDAPITVLVTNNDSTDPLRWGGPFGKVVRVETSTAVQTTTQATDTATALLNQRAGLARSLTITAAPNPALEASDVITVDFGGGRTETHLIDTVQLGLTAAGEQTLASRTL